MGFLHKELDLAAGESVEVTLSAPANVQLLDPANYGLYSQGKAYRYHGGYFTASPAVLTAPSAGRWHLTVDLGGGAGSVRASVRMSSSQPV